MASDKADKKERKKEKKEKKDKLSDDGVKKVKSEKKDKKKKSKDVTEALETELERSGIIVPINEDVMEVDDEATPTPLGALVPFANPLADEKQTKKLLKSVKKGMRSAHGLPRIL